MGVLNEQMKQVVERVRLAFVATICLDGTPNVSPKGTLCVLDDEHLIFADLRSPGTIANLRSNPGVEVNVVDSFSRKGYRFKGSAVVHEHGPAFEELVGFFNRRKLSDAPRRIRSIVVIRVASARPLISPGYDQGTTEEDMKAQWKQHYLGSDLTAV